jgi:hypothetical protein
MRFVAKERSLLCTLAYAIFSVTEVEKGSEIGKANLLLYFFDQFNF